jgi:hypothetical protein
MPDAFQKATIEVLPKRGGFIKSIRVTVPPNGATERTLHKHPFVVTVSERIELDREIWEGGKSRIVHEVYQPNEPVYRPAGIDQRVINRSAKIAIFDKDTPPTDGRGDTVGIFVAEMAEPQDLATAFPDPGIVESEIKFARGLVPTDTLKANVADLLNKMGQVLEAAPDPIGGAWQLDEVLLAVEISAQGAVSLIGSASGVFNGKSGLTFRLRRAAGD